MSSRQEMQRFIRFWKEKTGATEVDMHEVAKLAAEMGWNLPVPQSPIDLLAKRFKDAARDETEYDKETGQPYRVYHAVPAMTADGQTSMFVYVDISDAKRNVMLKSAVIRREQMIGDGLQLTLDLDHWNRINPKDEPIELPMDLGPDIEWRKNTPDDDEEVG